MVIKCCVFGCENAYKTSDRNTSFHRFPKNPNKKAIWENNIQQINGSSWQPVSSTRVCSEHFDGSSWEKIREHGGKILKYQAMPSIFNNIVPKVENNYLCALRDITNIQTSSSMDRDGLLIHDHTYSRVSKRNFFKTVNSMKDTFDVPILNSAEKDISPISEIKSSVIDNEDSDVIKNSSNVFTCTAASSNTLNVLPKMNMKVKAMSSAETIKEIKTDMIHSLRDENKKLKAELARLKKVAGKVHRTNDILRNSNKKLRQKNQILENIQGKRESILTKFNTDQKKAMYKKKYQSVHWETKTLKQALVLKLKCGTSGYKELKKTHSFAICPNNTKKITTYSL